MRFSIKPATLKNLPQIQGLNQLLFEKEYCEYDPDLNLNWTLSQTGNKYFKNRITQKDSCVFVALSKNKIIGYLCGGLIKPNICRGSLPSAELENTFILPEYRSLGLGSALYKKFYNWCKKNKVKRIIVHAYTKNEKGINFYQKNHFNNLSSILEAKVK